MFSEKDIIKIREKINERYAKLNIDWDLMSAEEIENIKQEIASFQQQEMYIMEQLKDM